MLSIAAELSIGPLVLEQLAGIRQGELVFPGQRRGRPLSGTAMRGVLRRLKIEGPTIHGFRSSFRDWTSETTTYPREIAEMALAHQVGNEVERAYRRTDLLEKRRELMQAWAEFCEPQDSNVVSIIGRT